VATRSNVRWQSALGPPWRLNREPEVSNVEEESEICNLKSEIWNLKSAIWNPKSEAKPSASSDEQEHPAVVTDN
jgi:hypothetical protein